MCSGQRKNSISSFQELVNSYSLGESQRREPIPNGRERELKFDISSLSRVCNICIINFDSHTIVFWRFHHIKFFVTAFLKERLHSVPYHFQEGCSSVEL